MPATDPSERQHHIQVARGEVGRYVFLPGDPGRCEPIARHFDEPKLVARNREYETWTGYLDGEMVSVTSTGIGCPSSAIAMEELVRVGADTFVRVGTSGAMQPYIAPGDLGVIHAAIRDEGTTLHYLPVEFPAVADLEVTRGLALGARSTGKTVHIGISQSKDSFYGQHEPGRMPVANRLKERWSAWMAGGAICSEMEAAALYIVAATLHVRAGGIMWILGHSDQSALTPEEEAAVGTLDDLLVAAIAGMRQVISQDRELAGASS
jgi:uridine phosphorylase